MSPILATLVGVVFVVIALNFIMLYIRLKRDFPLKSQRKAPDEARAAIVRDREVRYRIEVEQENAERRVELRNKTFELYEQVRRSAAAEEEH